MSAESDVKEIEKIVRVILGELVRRTKPASVKGLGSMEAAAQGTNDTFRRFAIYLETTERALASLGRWSLEERPNLFEEVVRPRLDALLDLGSQKDLLMVLVAQGLLQELLSDVHNAIANHNV